MIFGRLIGHWFSDRAQRRALASSIAIGASDGAQIAESYLRLPAGNVTSFEYHSVLRETQAENDRLTGENFDLRLEIETFKDLLSAKDQSILGLRNDTNAKDRIISDLRAQVANAETDGPKRDLEKFNDAQSARSMSRQTKDHFRAYQYAVGKLLDQLDGLGKKNSVTKEDLRKLRQLRVDLGNEIGRTI